jgi:hypothetical protein
LAEFFTFEFVIRAIKALGIPEVKDFHDFLWFFEIRVTTSPQSRRAAPLEVKLQHDFPLEHAIHQRARPNPR